jgi:hypothetical protein
LGFLLRQGWHCQFLEEDLKKSLPRRVVLDNTQKLFEAVERAFAVAAWLQRADQNGLLGSSHFNPSLTPEERGVADIEAWILGVV